MNTYLLISILSVSKIGILIQIITVTMFYANTY